MKKTRTFLLSAILISQVVIIGMLVDRRVQESRFSEEIVSGRLFDTIVANHMTKAGNIHFLADSVDRVPARWDSSEAVQIDLLGGGRVSIAGDVVELSRLSDFAKNQNWPARGLRIVNRPDIAPAQVMELFDALKKAGVFRVEIDARNCGNQIAQPGATDNPDGAQRFREDH